MSTIAQTQSSGAASPQATGDHGNLFCHWQHACSYVDIFREHTCHLTDKFTEESVVAYCLKIEETFRAFAIETIRAERKSPKPWGQALLAACREKSHLWQETKDLLRPIRAAALPAPLPGGQSPSRRTSSPALSSRPRGASGKGGGGAASGKGGGAAGQQAATKRLPATAVLDEHNKPICKSYNDQRGCKWPCQSGKSHVCDILIRAKSGSGEQACGLVHSRRQHNASAHGTPILRP
jgi:hypothetical protein